MTFSAEKLPDVLLVLIDIDDPVTYDKEFQRQIRYSPYVCGGTEFSAHSRKVIRSRKESPDELFVNKFIVEVLVDKFGDFVVQFIPNPLTQRSLIFRKLHWSGPDVTDIPDSVLKEMEEDGVDPEEVLMEEQELTHIYELTSGPALMLHDSDNSDDIDDEDIEAMSTPVTSKLKSKLKVESSETEDEEDETFVVPVNKTVH